MDPLTVTINDLTIVLQPEWLDKTYKVTDKGEIKFVKFIDLWNHYRFAVQWLGIAKKIEQRGIIIEVFEPTIAEELWAQYPKLFDR